MTLLPYYWPVYYYKKGEIFAHMDLWGGGAPLICVHNIMFGVLKKPRILNVYLTLGAAAGSMSTVGIGWVSWIPSSHLHRLSTQAAGVHQNS